MSKLSEEKIHEWKENIVNQQASGLSIERWCKEKNIAANRFFYWKKKLFSKSELTHSSFVELKNKTETGVYFEYSGIKLSVDRVFDPVVLKQCLKTLLETAC